MTHAAFLIVAALLVQNPRVAWVPNPRATYGGWVADPSGRLHQETRDSLNSLITRLEDETSAEIAIVVIDSTSGLDTRRFAVELHNLWGVGKAGRDNGILILWVPTDRSVFVSVGDGLTAGLPDGWVAAQLNAHLFPAFRRGEFDRGMLAMVGVLERAIRGLPSRGIAARGIAARLMDAVRGLPPTAGAAAAGAAGIAWLLYRSYLRRRPRLCPKCGRTMRVLSEGADDAMLQDAERMEESISSVDYDVWVCDHCGEKLKLEYARWFSGYGRCPDCGRKTLKTTSTTLIAATTTSTGTRRVHAKCRFCTHERTYEETIPRRTRSASRGGRSFGGGRASGGGAGGRY